MRIIKTGICSFGMSGKLYHAPFIESHPGYELTGIVERHKSESRQKYPGSTLYRSVEELIADPSIELVIVNTPVQTHYEYTAMALEAGKDVVTEKPFTINAAEAIELNELARKNNRLLSVYQNKRHDPEFLAIKDVLDQDLLGPIREAELRYDRYRVTPSGKAHKENDLPGAGNLHDTGVHLIDQALQLFGWPDALFADLETFRENMVANDYFELILYYNKLRVRVKGSLMARKSRESYVIHGVNGSFMQHRSDAQEKLLLKDVVPTIEPWCPPPVEPDGYLFTTVDGKDIIRPTTSPAGNYMNYFDDLYKALNGAGPNPVPASDAILSMKILDAAFLSAAERRVVPL